MYYVRAPALLAVLGLIILAAGCGGTGGLPSDIEQTQHTLQEMRQPTKSPAPLQIFNPYDLSILQDTSNSTSGVFLGADCGAGATITCADFAETMRHRVSMGTVYSTWDQDIDTVIARDGLAAMEAQDTIPDITWQASSNKATITLAQIASGKYDSYITDSAQELASFGQPIFIRLFHEFNTKRYNWGLYRNGADRQADADFVAAWQHIVAIFRRQHANNVKFIWCFNSGTSPVAPWNEPAAAYPGDAYVDWLAFDGYNMGNDYNGHKWFSFTFMAGGAYHNAIAASQNKPVMIVETASNEYGDGGAMKAAWVDAMFATLQSTHDPYPHLRALSWYESDSPGYLYDSKSTPPSYRAFTLDIRIYQPDGILHFRSNGSALFTITTP